LSVNIFFGIQLDAMATGMRPRDALAFFIFLLQPIFAAIQLSIEEKTSVEGSNISILLRQCFDAI
jgi:hypothetical protein